MLEQAKSYLQPANRDPATMTPEDAQKELAMAMPKLAAGGDEAKQARERIVAIMAAQLQISPDDAAKRFDDAQAQLTDGQGRGCSDGQGRRRRDRERGLQGCFPGLRRLLLGGAAAAVAARWRSRQSRHLRGADRPQPVRLRWTPRRWQSAASVLAYVRRADGRI